jgi:hypothetical protein
VALLDPHDTFPAAGSRLCDHPVLMVVAGAALSPLIPLVVWAVTACAHSLGLYH